jgi:hypothetical protein
MENEKTAQQVQAELDAQAFVLKTISDVFVEYGVAAGCTTPAESLQSLRNYLTDAAAMHAVMRGEQKASELLAGIEKLIPPEIFQSIVLDLSIFLAPRLQKFMQELVGGTKPAVIAAMLETGLKGWEAHRPIFERRMLTIQQLQRRLQELFTQAGINNPQEMQSIETEVSRAIGGDVLALARLESGDLNEVDRLFCERTRRDKISIQ